MKNIIKKILWENEKQKIPFQKIVELSSKYSLPIQIELSPGENKWGKPIYFWYGDFPHHINPHDNMGWDIICLKNPEKVENQKIQGVVLIHPQANTLPKNIGNRPGNHKLILSNDLCSNEEKEKLKKFFANMPAFLNPIFFDETDITSVIHENWEKEILGKYKLGHFKDRDYQGIAVGPTARKLFNAPSM